MRFNDKDKKNFRLTFTWAILLFMGLFLAVEFIGEGAESFIERFRRSSSDAVNSLGEIAPDIKMAIKESIDNNFSIENTGDKISEIIIQVSADEIVITSTDEDSFRTVLSDEADEKSVISAYKDNTVYFASLKRINSGLTIEIPKKILEDNTIKIDIDANCNIISVRDIFSADDDSIRIESVRGIISAVSSDFGRMEFESDKDPVVISDCTADVLKCVSENSGIKVDGKYSEVSIRSAEDVIFSVDSSVKRIDASSERGSVTVNFSGEAIKGYTARLINCGSVFEDEYEGVINNSSRQGNILYEYGDGTIKINITDTKGNISINQYGD